MCGILGQLGLRKPVNQANFKAMLATQSHRGPDDSGIQYFSGGHIAFGHKRLSIIDLSDNAKQPMTDSGGQLCIIFNGELYNFRGLRKELESLGCQFRSQSDTEVVLYAYQQWGADCVSRFRGIFAFGILDIAKQTLFLARDHAGVKPLYYFRSNDTFIFASEPRAILENEYVPRQIAPEGFQLFLTYGNLPADHSIYQGIKKLLPGCCLNIDRTGNLSIKNYWRLTYNPVITSAQHAQELIRSRVDEAIRLQTVSDVPISTLLSGGIDSTIITAGLRDTISYDLSSFNIGFDDKASDESGFAQRVSEQLQTRHTSRTITSSVAIAQLPALVEILDEPFHLNGVFPYLALSQLVKSNGFKVAFGGDGADELFAGYIWYEMFDQYVSSRSGFGWRSMLHALSHRNTVGNGLVEHYASYNGYLDPSTIKKLTGTFDPDLHFGILNAHWEPSLPTVLSAQLLDFNTFLPDHCLTKVDRLSMSQGLEVRVPFLDIDLIEAAFSIDHEIVYHARERKALLKSAMDSCFPAGMDTSRKKGFSSPLNRWLKGGLSQLGHKLINNSSLAEAGLFDQATLLRTYPELAPKNQLLIIGLELWYRHWLLGERVQIDTG